VGLSANALIGKPVIDFYSGLLDVQALVLACLVFGADPAISKNCH
jgi:hypothetical protein